jgi:hypothetical protein
MSDEMFKTSSSKSDKSSEVSDKADSQVSEASL